MDQSKIRKHMRIAIASSFAAMLIIAGGIGHALAEDDDDELPDTKFFKSLLTNLGLKKDGEQSGIEYRERAPLVVPPTRDLPPPQTTDPAAGNPAWPVDQDEKRRREAAKKRKGDKPFEWTDLSRQLGPAEMKKGATTGKDTALSKRSAENPEQYQQQSTPSQLGYKGGLFDFANFFSGNNKDETTKFEAEPPRASLTDPPVGYRSPSPSQPYGVRSDSSKKAPGTDDRVNVGTGSTAR
jgi:hypothetical protein